MLHTETITNRTTLSYVVEILEVSFLEMITFLVTMRQVPMSKYVLAQY